MRWEEYKNRQFSIAENDKLIDQIFGLQGKRDSEIRVSYSIPLYPNEWRGGSEPEQQAMYNDSKQRCRQLLDILQDYDDELWIEEDTKFEGGALAITVRGDLDKCREALLNIGKDDRIKQLMSPLSDQALTARS